MTKDANLGHVAAEELRAVAILALRLAKDGAAFVLLWALLYGIHAFQAWLPLPGFAAAMLDLVHQASTVLLYSVLVVTALEDLLRARGRRRRR